MFAYKLSLLSECLLPCDFIKAIFTASENVTKSARQEVGAPVHKRIIELQNQRLVMGIRTEH